MPRRCLQCNKQPNYGLSNDQIPTYCTTHKQDGMINITSKRCLQLNCKKRPLYGLETDSKPTYCKNHKTPDMIDIKNKRCSQLNCKKQPSYGLSNDQIPTYCTTHKQDGMIDIKNKRCLECNKIPSYGLVNDQIPTYCATHKRGFMVNVVKKRCLQCNKRPTFGLVTDSTPTYCAIHKQDGMINITSKRCLECNKIPTFGLVTDQIPKYCATHKTKFMIDVVNKRCLVCNKQPNYGLVNDQRPTYCATHKTKLMVNIVSKQCITHLCGTHANPKYKGYCSRCYYYTFPDEPHSRNYKTKELMVTDYIKDQFEDVKMQFDKVIPNGCSKRRPDILIDCGTHVIIVEIDENSHRQYESTCENKRICELYQDLGFANIVFIRFNPDGYTNSLNKKISSSFKIEKETGKCVLIDKKQWNLRLLALKQIIQNSINNIPSKSISVEYLYYDEI